MRAPQPHTNSLHHQLDLLHDLMAADEQHAATFTCQKGCFNIGQGAIRRYTIVMKRTVFALALLLLAAPLAAQTTERLQDRAGRSTGSAVTTGDTTQFYDRAGRSLGSAHSEGDATINYDRAGRKLGSARKEGGVTTFDDRAGRRVGSARSDSDR